MSDQFSKMQYKCVRLDRFSLFDWVSVVHEIQNYKAQNSENNLQKKICQEYISGVVLTVSQELHILVFELSLACSIGNPLTLGQESYLSLRISHTCILPYFYVEKRLHALHSLFGFYTNTGWTLCLLCKVVGEVCAVWVSHLPV